MSGTIKHFDDGSLVWVQLHKNAAPYKGKVLASSDVSTMEHGYEVFKVELEQTVKEFDGQYRVYRWVHPRPVQGYKLSRRVE